MREGWGFWRLDVFLRKHVQSGELELRTYCWWFRYLLVEVGSLSQYLGRVFPGGRILEPSTAFQGRWLRRRLHTYASPTCVNTASGKVNGAPLFVQDLFVAWNIHFAHFASTNLQWFCLTVCVPHFFRMSLWEIFITQTLNVWYIHLHSPSKLTKCRWIYHTLSI